MTTVLSTQDLKTQLHRGATIQGLRELADWLHKHPDVPVPTHRIEILHSVLAENDEAEAAELRRIADAVETTADFSKTHPDVTIDFGPVTYRTYMVPEQDMKQHKAFMSYRNSVQVDEVVPT